MLEAGRFILTLNASFWWPHLSVVFAQMEELLGCQPACRRAPTGVRTSLSAQRAQRAHPSPFTNDRNASKFFKSARGSSYGVSRMNAACASFGC